MGHDPSDQLAELILAARRGQGAVPYVVLDVEVRVVDPDRPAEVEGNEPHNLAVPGHQGQLAGDRAVHVAVARRRALEDGHRRDVHVADAVLHVQERGIHRAQSVHSHGHPLVEAHLYHRLDTCRAQSASVAVRGSTAWRDCHHIRRRGSRPRRSSPSTSTSVITSKVC